MAELHVAASRPRSLFTHSRKSQSIPINQAAEHKHLVAHSKQRRQRCDSARTTDRASWGGRLRVSYACIYRSTFRSVKTRGPNLKNHDFSKCAMHPLPPPPGRPGQGVRSGFAAHVTPPGEWGQPGVDRGQTTRPGHEAHDPRPVAASASTRAVLKEKLEHQPDQQARPTPTFKQVIRVSRSFDPPYSMHITLIVLFILLHRPVSLHLLLHLHHAPALILEGLRRMQPPSFESMRVWVLTEAKLLTWPRSARSAASRCGEGIGRFAASIRRKHDAKHQRAAVAGALPSAGCGGLVSLSLTGACGFSAIGPASSF